MVFTGRTTSGTWLAGVTLPTIALVGTTMGQALRFLGQIGTWEEPGCNPPYMAVGTTEVGNWWPCAGSASMSTHIQCPWMPVLPCMLMVPNGEIVTLHVVWRCPRTSSMQNSLCAVWSELGEGMTSFPTFQFPLKSVQGSWSDLDMTALKWACFQVTVAP